MFNSSQQIFDFIKEEEGFNNLEKKYSTLTLKHLNFIYLYENALYLEQDKKI